MTDRIEKDGGKLGDDEARLLREEAQALEHDARELEHKAHEMEDRAHRLEDLAHEIEEEQDHGHNHGDHHHGHDGKVKITMVVNGQPTVVEADKDELLGDVRRKALEQTHNLAQPAESWEIKTEAGDQLDPGKRVGEFDFGCEVTLFLSLGAGDAGA